MIIIMGIAGAGKGTQGHLLADRGYTLISTGELFREAMASGKYPELLQGRLVSDEETIQILNDTIAKLHPDEEFILDGFPRNVAQTRWVLDQIESGKLGSPVIIHLILSKEASRERLKLRHRPDDTEEAINRRFEIYDHETKPILNLFEEHGLRVCDIDADRSIEAVHQSVVKCIEAKA